MLYLVKSYSSRQMHLHMKILIDLNRTIDRNQLLNQKYRINREECSNHSIILQALRVGEEAEI